MRGRTRNIVENVVTFIIFVLILFGIYLVIINYTDIGKKLDLISPQKIIEKIAQKEKKVKEIIGEKILNEQDENNTFDIKPIKEKNIELKEEKKELPPQTTQESKESKTKPITIKTTKAEEPIKEKVKKEEPKKETIAINTQKKDETNKQKEVEQKKQEPKKPVLTDALIKEKFALINSFLRGTKKQINEKVEQLVLPKTDKQRYANIRITVLEDGRYESLTLMDGDKEYFEQISPAILSVFPIVLDERIEDQFPRYFRMKIIEEK